MAEPLAFAFVDGPTARRSLLAEREPRVLHFVRRVRERGDDPAEMVIVLLQVDDPAGGALADHLMPGFDWRHVRDLGQEPIAQGLTRPRDLVADYVTDCGWPEAAAKLRATPAGEVAVCVIGWGGVLTAHASMLATIDGRDVVVTRGGEG